MTKCQNESDVAWEKEKRYNLEHRGTARTLLWECMTQLLRQRKGSGKDLVRPHSAKIRRLQRRWILLVVGHDDKMNLNRAHS